MRIISSDVVSQSVQQQTTERLQQRREQVSTLDQDTLQQRFNRGSDIMDVGQGHLIFERKRSADREASVTLELTTTHSERLALQAASVVTGPGDTVSSYLSQSILEAVTASSQQAEFTITRSLPTGSNGSPTDATFIEISTVESVETHNSVQMNTMGTVTTADGREINFLMQLDFERLTQREQVNTFVGNVDLIDPLAINLNGESVQLSDEVFDFDLNADGELDSVSRTASGSGYLVFDRNGNGKIDDGSELFGPSTGYGYQELAELDDDGNGWIDEGDAAFQQLGFMQFDDQGQPVIQSLSTVGLGALSLTSAETRYDLLDSEGELQAQVKRSGAALMENGAIAVVQELNLRNFVSESSLGYIDDDGQEDTTMNPLAFFQESTDIRIQERNEETQVRIQGNNLLAQASLEPVLQRPTSEEAPVVTIAFQGEITQRAEASVSRQEQTYDSETRRLAVERMQANLDFSTTTRVSQTYVFTPEAAEHRFLNNLPTGWQFDQTPQDGALERLKNLVESLKEMQQHQKESLEKLGLYQSIGRLN